MAKRGRRVSFGEEGDADAEAAAAEAADGGRGEGTDGLRTGLVPCCWTIKEHIPDGFHLIPSSVDTEPCQSLSRRQVDVPGCPGPDALTTRAFET